MKTPTQPALPLRSNEDVRALFSLKRPCADCPFRLDVPGYLTGDRAQTIADELQAGVPFFCHKTTTVPGVHVTDRRARYCAGAQLFTLAQDFLTTPSRLAVALGLWHPTELHQDVPVCASAEAFVAKHGGGE